MLKTPNNSHISPNAKQSKSANKSNGKLFCVNHKTVVGLRKFTCGRYWVSFYRKLMNSMHVWLLSSCLSCNVSFFIHFFLFLSTNLNLLLGMQRIKYWMTADQLPLCIKNFAQNTKTYRRIFLCIIYYYYAHYRRADTKSWKIFNRLRSTAFFLVDNKK